MEGKNDCSDRLLPFLELRQSGEKWKTFFLKDDKKVSIGRSPTSDILVAFNNISRTHAILMKDTQQSNSPPATWLLKDNKSLNGVFLNGVKIQADEWKRLKSGDVLHLGPPSETDLSIKFIQTVKNRREDPPQLHKPPKISKNDTMPQVVAPSSEGGTLPPPPPEAVPEEEEVRTGELEKKLQVLEEQLKEKERLEQILQGKLQKQEEELRESVQERERLLRKRDQEELILRQSLEKMLEEKEHLLRETLANQQEEQQKMHSETESKARCLEQELAEVQRLRERARADVVGHFGELMETEFTCSICTELFIEAVTLNCAHTFCRLCITQWKRKKKECPICRAKIKGNETRALAIDNFISGMVKHLEPEVAERRQSLLKERATSTAAGSKGGQSTAATRVQGMFPQPGQLSASMSVLLRPTVHNNLNPGAGIRNPTVVVSRILAPFPQLATIGTNATVLRPRPGNPVPSVQTRMPPPLNAAPNVAPRQRWPATAAAGTPNVMLGQRVPGTAPHRGHSPYVLVPRFQYTLPPGGVVTLTRSRVSAAAAVVASTSVSSNAQNSGVRTQSTVTYAVTGAIPSTSSVGGSSNSPPTNPSTSAVVVSDSPVGEVSTIVISDEESQESSVEGNSGVYYGGYGRCFKCNRRGHWSNGCPFNT